MTAFSTAITSTDRDGGKLKVKKMQEQAWLESGEAKMEEGPKPSS